MAKRPNRLFDDKPAPKLPPLEERWVPTIPIVEARVRYVELVDRCSRARNAMGRVDRSSQDAPKFGFV